MRWYALHARPYRAEHTTALNIVVNYYTTKPGCRDLSITCTHIIYSRTLSSLEDNLKMASRGQNM